MDFDKDFLLAHGFDDFPNIASRLLQQLQLLLESSYARVELVSLRFETTQVDSFLCYLALCQLDLALVETHERHLGSIAQARQLCLVSSSVRLPLKQFSGP
jgi:hypothetical protein